MAVTIECSGCGHLKIGPAIDALEEETTGLGAAFYWVLTYALYPVMRLYNHDDALMFEERMRECADAEDAENLDQYEFPEIEKALPDCIRKTLKPRHKNWALDARRLLWRFRNGRYRSWIERLRQIQRFSRIRLKQSRDWIENGNYDSPPLPSLLVAFKERDAILDHAIPFRNANSGHLALCSNHHTIMVCATILRIVDGCRELSIIAPGSIFGTSRTSLSASAIYHSFRAGALGTTHSPKQGPIS